MWNNNPILRPTSTSKTVKQIKNFDAKKRNNICLKYFRKNENRVYTYVGCQVFLSGRIYIENRFLNIF